MKRKSVLADFIVFALVLVMFAGCGMTTNQPFEQTERRISDLSLEEKRDELQGLVEQFYAQQGGFSGVVLVSRGGEVIFGEAFGVADHGSGIYNTLDTPFFIGGITKAITGAAVMMLEMDGKLDVSYTLDNFFTGHHRLAHITVEQLIAQEGGFGGSTPLAGAFIADPDRPRDMTPLDLEPYVIERLNWVDIHNSNVDYWVLGRVIEQVSEMAYDEFVAARIFEPLGMRNSGIPGAMEAAMPLHVPIPAQDAYSLMLDTPDFGFFINYSSSGLIASANDLNIWMGAFFGGELFPEYMLEHITYGDELLNYGWRFHESGLWYQSTGARTVPVSNKIIYDPGSDTRIIVLSNLVTGNNEAIALAEMLAEGVLGVRM